MRTHGSKGAALSAVVFIAAVGFGGWAYGRASADQTPVRTVAEHSLALDADPTISIADTSATEGTNVTSTMGFVVTLSQPAASIVTVHYQTNDGSAVAPWDYSAVDGFVTFAPGDTTATINVPLDADTLYENSETFGVTLDTPSGASVLDGSAEATILDDEPFPTLSIGNAFAPEGDSGTTLAGLPVELSGESAVPVTVHYQTSDGTATAPDDYLATDGMLTIAPSSPGHISRTATATVPVVGDTIFEDPPTDHLAHEAFNVTLDTPVGATISDGLGLGIILDDEPIPAISIDDSASAEGDTGTSNMEFAVRLSGRVADTVTVRYQTNEGTARAATDYVSTSGTLTFDPLQTIQSLDVPIVGDSLPEFDETFTVTLDVPRFASIDQLPIIGDGSATGTIRNDDPGQPPSGPIVGIGDASVWEGDTGKPRVVSFPVTISQPSTSEIDVVYRIVAGTASGDKVDIDDLHGGQTRILRIAPQAKTGLTPSSKPINVKVTPDTGVEGNETFSVELVRIIGGEAVIGRSIGVGTIYDDDPGTGLRVGVGSVAAVEGNTGQVKMTFRITLSSPAPSTLSVLVTAHDITAVTGVDYKLLKPKTLTFKQGQFQKAVSVVFFANSSPQIDRTMNLVLSNPNGMAIQSDGIGVGTIRDDD